MSAVAGRSFWARLRVKLGATTHLPTKWAVAVSMLCGVVTVLNQAAFGLPTIWKTTITDVLALFAFLMVGPILGPKFRALLHLPAAVGTGIGLAMMVGMVVTQQDAAMPERAIIIGVIQVLGGLGFAPQFVPTLQVP